MGRKLVFSLILTFLIAITAAGAQEQATYISNSANWQDVYSVMQYAFVTGNQGFFLVSTRHSTLLINQLNPSSNYVIVSSSDQPYVVGYKSVLESRGFNSVDEIRSKTINLDLAKQLPDNVNSFIIIDGSYGYNAISVAPYAALSKSFVLFANSRNINQVYNFLASRNPDSVLIYGQVDREVKDRLAEFNPEVINENDRFQNNLKIVDKYQALYTKLNGEPKTQAILTNGEFIEQEIMSGVEPVVFIGRSNVPDVVKNYIQSGDIDIGILIGNELIGSATSIRRDLGISVFVKFAQSARSPSATISPVEDLDRFYLPSYILNLDVFSIVYNRLQNRIEVTYQNKVDLATYLKGTITLRNGDQTQILGDEEPIFLDKGEFKTIAYETKSDGTPLDPMSGNISADVFTIFGESQNALEYTLRKTMSVETVNIMDNSKMEIGKVLYDKRSGNFLVEVINTGDVDAFVRLEMVDILINDEIVTIGSAGTTFIGAGKSAMIEIPTAMQETDLENNPTVVVKAYYGERERSLVNIIQGEYQYGYTGFGYMTGQVLKDIGKGAVLFGPLLIIIILLILIMGMKKKCPHCDEINNLRSKRCKRCGAEI